VQTPGGGRKKTSYEGGKGTGFFINKRRDGLDDNRRQQQQGASNTKYERVSTKEKVKLVRESGEDTKHFRNVTGRKKESERGGQKE